MTTEYDKARNPTPLTSERLSRLQAEVDNLTDRLSIADQVFDSLNMRLDELDKRSESLHERLMAVGAHVDQVEDRPPSPAQHPLFDSTLDRQKRPSQAWTDTGENLEPNILLSIESCLEDVKDKLDRQRNALETMTFNDIQRHQEVFVMLRILAKPAIKEAETWPKEAPPDSEHFSCKRCGWRMGLNHHRTSRVMGLPETGTVACPGCASLKGWDRIGRNRDTVNIPTQEAL